MTFNPLDAAHDILVETRIADPDRIAELVFESTPKREIAQAYKLVLRRVVMDAIRLANMSAGRADCDAVPTPVNSSSRLRAIRGHHIAKLDQRVLANGQWKLLGDCTYDDVMDLAAQRHAVATRNALKAAEFEKLAAQMLEFGAKTVRDLEAAAA